MIWICRVPIILYPSAELTTIICKESFFSVYGKKTAVKQIGILDIQIKIADYVIPCEMDNADSFFNNNSSAESSVIAVSDDCLFTVFSGIYQFGISGLIFQRAGYGDFHIFFWRKEK